MSGGAAVAIDVKAGMDCGTFPKAIFSASFSADLTAVGLRRFRIQFCVCVCVSVRCQWCVYMYVCGASCEYMHNHIHV